MHYLYAASIIGCGHIFVDVVMHLSYTHYCIHKSFIYMHVLIFDITSLWCKPSTIYLCHSYYFCYWHVYTCNTNHESSWNASSIPLSARKSITYHNSLNPVRQLSFDMLVEYSLHDRMISVTGAHEFSDHWIKANVSLLYDIVPIHSVFVFSLAWFLIIYLLLSNLTNWVCLKHSRLLSIIIVCMWSIRSSSYLIQLNCKLSVF